MASISLLMAANAGLLCPELPFKIQQVSKSMSRYYNTTRLVSKWIPRREFHDVVIAADIHTKYAASAGRSHHELSFSDNSLEEPFWLTLIKEAYWALKSLFIFLLEQPSQLKYIEWPSFQSTLKTASLTLVLVALLIVALASVDSTLCYLLALLLRKTP
ncbi:hypothetical protein NMG60_11015853 [Bertholletia excelsa]